jgi:hypothetical protein
MFFFASGHVGCRCSLRVQYAKCGFIGLAMPPLRRGIGPALSLLRGVSVESDNSHILAITLATVRVQLMRVDLRHAVFADAGHEVGVEGGVAHVGVQLAEAVPRLICHGCGHTIESLTASIRMFINQESEQSRGPLDGRMM